VSGGWGKAADTLEWAADGVFRRHAAFAASLAVDGDGHAVYALGADLRRSLRRSTLRRSRSA